MSKDLANRNTGSQGKSLYNIGDAGSIDGSQLSTLLSQFLSGGGSVTTDQFGAVAPDGDKVFGVLSADMMTGNITAVLQKLTIGQDNLLQMIPSDLKIINDNRVYGVLITTNNMTTTGSTGYTGIDLAVPYIYDDADHVPVTDNKEAPDNFFNIKNTKVKITGPFTYIKSIKTAFTDPIITLGYYDRVDASTIGSTELTLKKYEKGIAMERVEADGGTVKFSFMGYSQNLDRFVFYRTGQYTGTDPYRFVKKDGTPASGTGILTEYNIDRIAQDNSIGSTQDPLDVTTNVDIDSLYTNTISSADHTYTRKLNINAYDDMTIKVGVDLTETSPPTRNYDFLLSTEGGLTMKSTGTGGAIYDSTQALKIRSQTSTYINADTGFGYTAKPIYIGNGSTAQLSNYLQVLGQLQVTSSDSVAKTVNTQMEIGGSFTAQNSTGSLFLIDGELTGSATNDTHGILSKPKFIIPPTSTNSAVWNASNVTLDPPDLTIGVGASVQKSCTLCVTGASTEAVENYALYVDSGIVKFKGPNNSYISWADDALNLYNAHIYVNPQPGSNVPYLEIGTKGKSTNIYALSRTDVIGENELFVDGLGPAVRIPIIDNTVYSITATITAGQADGKSCMFRINFTMTIIGGIKTVRQYKMDSDWNCDDIFDFIISHSGDATNWVTSDGFTFTGYNSNGSATRWLSNTFVSVLTVV